jgi:xanthine dehydrogenase accessory factor
MKEIQDIIRAFDLAETAGKKTALATVVHVDGSSYRRPGARMLIASDGQLTGAISGGCLEGDALRKAQLVMMEKKPMLVTYDTNDEDDAKLGMGLGCNGIIHVLIEPVDHSDPANPVALLKAVCSKRQNAVLITVFSLHDKKNPQTGTCIAYLQEGNIFGHASSLATVLSAEMQNSMITQTSSLKHFSYGDHQLTAFIELIKPSVSMIVVGAGNDVKPLLGFADILGWETTVIDGRSNYATSDRFPSAKKVLIRKPASFLNELFIDDQTVFVLMTHNYNYDLSALRQLIKREVAYIGMLGPRKKLDRMLEELKQSDPGLADQELSAIHTPAGLDIGAETPEEIALSIISEIKSVLAGRQAGSLRGIPGVIHQRRENIIK